MKITKMMLTAVVAGSLMASGVALQAQDSTNTPAGGHFGMRPHGPNIDALAKKLDLTDDQKPKVKTALEDMQKKLRDLREDTSIEAADKRAKAKEIRKDLNAKLKDILTADQYAKWEKLEPGAHKHGGDKSAPPQQ